MADVIIQMRDVTDSNPAVGMEWGDKLLESRYILNVDISIFAIRWNIGCEGKRGVKNNCKAFDLGNKEWVSI